MASSFNEPSNDDFEEATTWLVRLRADEADDAERARFADWLAEDSAHAQAYAEVQRLFGDMCQAAARPVRPAANAQPTPQRLLRIPRFRRLVTAAALCLLMVGLAQYGIVADWLLADYRTGIGEIREITLGDGSQLLLDTDTAVTIDYGENLRHIRLLHGQARFQVARDFNRPFEVETEELVVRALGTVFAVYRSETGRVDVTVQEHAVRITPRELGQSREVAQGNRLRYRQGSGLGEAETVAMQQITAWQEHRLVFDDIPLATALTQLDRYRSGHVFLMDEELQRLPVTGAFSLDDPDAVLAAIRKALALRATSLGPWLVVLHR